MSPELSRRSLLLGGGALVAGATLAAAGAAAAIDQATPEPTGRRLSAAGRTQAGVARPATPQRNALHAVFAVPDTSRLQRDLAALGSAILALLDGPSQTPNPTLPDGPGDLTVHVGLGPRPLRAIDPSLPGATPMPSFARDDAIAADRRDGDLLVALASSDAGALRPALDHLLQAVPTLVPLWAEHGFRAAGEGTVARNPLGYLDGIIVPEGQDELDENVWITSGPLAGATVCVLRRLRLDRRAFTALDVPARDGVIGRHADGRPLSGGGPRTQVDLQAKTPEGEYLVPARAHARAAHPSFTGSALMLRRGYAFDRGPDPTSGVDDAGLLFVCFARDLDAFVRTQLRLDEVDDLMTYATATASGSFLVLPGFSRTRPLGSPLFT
ncbi:Dyp-type peroxidase [Cellulomonas edaphi]|uniref:Dyp-type peroxidase n=1 Tax=Cellulomonas edaphi TaxID=3053468 RepID=A0ABT7S3Z7_9CELL|nr:Dyp-type peroxidase [Cellulomons edaphi]MDM7830352.1 Dyp-type peroxidase [Cellulomons edaphi]